MPVFQPNTVACSIIAEHHVQIPGPEPAGSGQCVGIVGYGVTGTAAQHRQDNGLRAGQRGNVRFGKRPVLKMEKKKSISFS